MKTVTLVALNIKGYYSPAPYLLRDYVLQDKAIRARYRFHIIDPAVVFFRKWRPYGITVRERLEDFWRSARRGRARDIAAWARVQLKYWIFFVRARKELLWWWTFLRVLATRPGIVGFSCYVWNVEDTLRMARGLKRFSPGTIVVIGGQEVTNSAAEFRKDYPFIDFIVDGEGEETFRTILRELLNRSAGDVKAVPGLIGPGDQTCEMRKLVEQLEQIPSPYLSFRNDPRMLERIGRSRLGYMVETARGCPFKCSFCFESGKFTSVRLFPIEKVADQIIGISFFGIRKFHILDPVLCNSDGKRLRAVAEIIREANSAGNTDFSVEVYAELLKDDMMDSLDVFSSFDVGLQTYNPFVLKKINRFFNEEKFTRGLELLKERKKYFALYLIYGLPGETLFSFIKSLLFVLALLPPEIFINHLCVLRGTPLRSDAPREKLDYDPTPPYLIRSTATMTSDDINTCKNLCNSLTREFKASTGGMNHAQI